MASLRVRVADAQTVDYRGSTLHVAPGLNAGPTLVDALRRLERSMPTTGDRSDGATYEACDAALTDAYCHRLATMGAGGDDGCTTHITTVDARATW